MKFTVQRPKIWHDGERVEPGTVMDYPEHVIKQIGHAGVAHGKRGPKAAVHEEEVGEQQ